MSVPPRAASADDLFAFVARLRFMMEDATQLLSSTVAVYVLDQLKAASRPMPSRFRDFPRFSRHCANGNTDIDRTLRTVRTNPPLAQSAHGH